MSQYTEFVINIGTHASNQLVVNQVGISGTHARATSITDSLWLLEDVGSQGDGSTNGTWVDGLRVKKKTIRMDSKILLANKYPVGLKQIIDAKNAHFGNKSVFGVAQKPVAKPAAAPPIVDNDYSAEFVKLEMTYKMYQETKLNVQQASNLKRGAVQAGMIVLGALASAFTMGVGGFVGSAAGILLSSRISPAEKVAELTEEFKKNYICPKPTCSRFLGDIPFDNLKSQRQCMQCKAVWVK